MSEEMTNEKKEPEIVVPESTISENAKTEGSTTQPEESVKASEPSQTQAQVIIQKERGFAHYVGFAMLCVLVICFFFLPGITITYGVNCLTHIDAAVAWIFSAILSVIIWVIFKLKIKGVKKSFKWYLAFCGLIFAILVAIQLVKDINVFSNIMAMLCGANA